MDTSRALNDVRTVVRQCTEATTDIEAKIIAFCLCLASILALPGGVRDQERDECAVAAARDAAGDVGALNVTRDAVGAGGVREHSAVAER